MRAPSNGCPRYYTRLEIYSPTINVRFGSLADIFPLTEPCPLYPPKADMCAATRDVRFGPKADISPHLIDQFISAAE
jgi:hypothetical protein